MPDLTDLEMVYRPHQWPAWPYLPVVRHDNRWRDDDHGIIFAGKPPHVWVGVSLFDNPGQTILARMGRNELAKEYASWEDVFKEWRVD